MKKYIITLIIMFLVLPSLVSARGEPPVFIGYKVKVNSLNGIIMKTNDNKEVTIPNDTILDVNYEYEIDGKLYGSVEYNNLTGMVEISKTELLDKSIDLERYKSEMEKKLYVFDKGTYLYNGPSKAYGLVNGNIEIPVGTILTYKYGDEAWAYVTYNNTKGWIYTYTYDDIIYEEGAKVATIYTKQLYTINSIELIDSPITGNKLNITIPELTKINSKYIYSSDPYTTYYYVSYNGNEGWYKFTPLEVAEMYEEDFIVNSFEDADIYEKPSVDSNVLTSIKKDEEYNVIAIAVKDNIEDNSYESWSYIKYHDTTGWLHYYEKGKESENSINQNGEKKEETKKENKISDSTKIVLFSISIIIIILFIMFTVLKFNRLKKEEN